MPTTHPRINTVLEPSLYEAVRTLARREGVSLSQKVRDLVKDSIELIEDAGVEMIVEDRMRRPGKMVSLKEAKKRLKIK